MSQPSRRRPSARPTASSLAAFSSQPLVTLEELLYNRGSTPQTSNNQKNVGTQSTEKALQCGGAPGIPAPILSWRGEGTPGPPILPPKSMLIKNASHVSACEKYKSLAGIWLPLPSNGGLWKNAKGSCPTCPRGKVKNIGMRIEWATIRTMISQSIAS